MVFMIQPDQILHSLWYPMNFNFIPRKVGYTVIQVISKDSQTLIGPIPTSEKNHHFDWLITVKVDFAFFKLHMYYYVLIVYISRASLV